MAAATQRVHLVLGAGGVRCLSYAGALAALAEGGVEFETVSACSAGKMFGALMCGGMSPASLLEWTNSQNIRQLAGKRSFMPWLRMWRWPHAPYKHAEFPRAFVEAMGRDLTFAELSIPFSTIGIDMRSNQLLVYSRRTTPGMKVSEALRIATAMPFVYPPHEAGGRLVVDGALASQCPVWLAADYDESLPIVALQPRSALSGSLPANAIDYLGRMVEVGSRSRDGYLMRHMSRVHVVDIDCGDVRFDEFDLTADRKSFLCLAGRIAAEGALKHLSGAPAAPAERPRPQVSADTMSDDDRAAAGATHLLQRFHSGFATEVRNKVFVSYSRRDNSWRERIVTALKPYIRNKAMDVWADDRIASGAQWKAEIEAALRSTKVALLLVTHDFLASDFIHDVEMKACLDAAEREGLVILWVAVGASAYEETPLQKYQAVNDPRRPLNALSPSELDQALVDIGKKVKLALS